MLPTEFYNDLTAMLSGRKNITKLIEVLLYTSLLPILSPSLYSLADILQISTDSPKTLLFNHSNVVLFAQVTTHYTWSLLTIEISLIFRLSPESPPRTGSSCTT